MVVPKETGVTKPDEDIVAIATLLLNQVPPDVVSERLEVDPTHALRVPVMGVSAKEPKDRNSPTQSVISFFINLNCYFGCLLIFLFKKGKLHHIRRVFRSKC